MRALCAYVSLAAALAPTPHGGSTMAKNKKPDRGQKASPAERGAQQAKSSSMEAQAEHRVSQVTPADVAGKGRQKRFGHN
ncbi:hypothetical protein GCM10010393_25020 [Streptomyces gobitricini]|uniref:Secreted protein n=2 Tax=Streptomyces gobitricini TaxID=68211 RepID=A0ABN3LYS9_9ACTN